MVTLDLDLWLICFIPLKSPSSEDNTPEQVSAKEPSMDCAQNLLIVVVYPLRLKQGLQRSRTERMYTGKRGTLPTNDQPNTQPKTMLRFQTKDRKGYPGTKANQ